MKEPLDLKAIAHRLYSFRKVGLKALVFGLAWYFAPAWLFILVALYLYFVPFFQWTKFLPAFIAILVLYVLVPATFAYALLGVILFGWLLAIRDLLFIDRRRAYEILFLGLLFFLLRAFYMANGTIRTGSFVMALLVAALIGWLFQVLVQNFPAKEGNRVGLQGVAAWLVAWLSWQMLTACLFLPLDFVFQSVLVFLLLFPVIDLLPAYLRGELLLKKVMMTFSFFFAFIVIILAAAPLGL